MGEAGRDRRTVSFFLVQRMAGAIAVGCKYQGPNTVVVALRVSCGPFFCQPMFMTISLRPPSSGEARGAEGGSTVCLASVAQTHANQAERRRGYAASTGF